VRAFDFDVVVGSWGESLSPGNEQRGYWGSQAADQPGSRNLIGIKNPAVDKLVDRVITRVTGLSGLEGLGTMVVTGAGLGSSR
jgi:ABC-type oligopeptide transport system substrate-binding subunit